MRDLIDRQAAIDAIQKDRETGWEDSENDAVYRNACDDGYAYSMQIISELPSAERKKGKWIHDDPKDAIEEIFLARPKCSECGFEIAYETHFCPNCGADMRTSE